MGSKSHEERSANVERAASWLSMACAVHCLLMPVLTAALPLAGASVRVLQHPLFELALAALVTSGAAFTLLWGYRRHRDLTVLWGVLGGLAFYLLGHLSDAWFASALSVTGALLLAVSSFASARLSHLHSEHCAH